MKKKFEIAELELIMFECDVIVTSDKEGGGDLNVDLDDLSGSGGD